MIYHTFIYISIEFRFKIKKPQPIYKKNVFTGECENATKKTFLPKSDREYLSVKNVIHKYL